MMFGKDNKISNMQIALLTVHTIIGVGILSLPSTLAETVGTSGWISLVLSGIIAAVPVIMITKVTEKYRGWNLFEISSYLLGKTLTYITFTLLIINFIGQSAFVIRIFGEVIKMFLLFSTPIEVTIVTMLLTAVFTARGGIETIARLSLLVVPFILIPTLILNVVLIPDLDFTNLLPFFKNNFADVIKSIPATFFSFGGLEFLLVYMYYSKHPKSAMKYNIGAIVTVTVLYLLSFFITLARFGEKGLGVQLWPLLSLAKAIQFPNAFIENVEGIIMAIWVIVVFTTLMSAIFVASVLIRQMFRTEESKYFTLPLLPIIYFFSLIPRNVVLVYSYMQVFTYIFGTFASLIYPILLYILAVFKKKGEAKDETTI